MPSPARLGILTDTHSNLAFLLTRGPADQAEKWAALPADQRQQLKQQYNSAGVSLVVSAFGETEHPTSQDPATVANALAQFVLNTDLDGIDVDYEEFELVTAQPGVGEAWLTTLTQTLRQQLPQGQFILSHAREYLELRNVLCYGIADCVVQLSAPGSRPASALAAATSPLTRTSAPSSIGCVLMQSSRRYCG